MDPLESLILLDSSMIFNIVNLFFVLRVSNFCMHSTNTSQIHTVCIPVLGLVV